MTADYIIYIYIITGILLVLIILKTILFFSSTTNRRFENWFFFNSYAVYNSRNAKSRKAKLLQNRLTLFIIGLALADMIIFMLLRN